MRGPGRPQSVLAAAVLLLLAGCRSTGAQPNATLVVEGSGSNTAAEFVRSILKNASTVYAEENISLPFANVESPQGADGRTLATRA
jgi:hypothetical protein